MPEPNIEEILSRILRKVIIPRRLCCFFVRDFIDAAQVFQEEIESFLRRAAEDLVRLPRIAGCDEQLNAAGESEARILTTTVVAADERLDSRRVQGGFCEIRFHFILVRPDDDELGVNVSRHDAPFVFRC
jgi:hypothetical protein